MVIYSATENENSETGWKTAWLALNEKVSSNLVVCEANEPSCHTEQTIVDVTDQDQSGVPKDASGGLRVSLLLLEGLDELVGVEIVSSGHAQDTCKLTLSFS